MAELEACFENRERGIRKVWRHALPTGKEITIGRTPKSAQTQDWAKSDWIMDDPLISGQHAKLMWQNGKLNIKRRMLPSPTTNLIYHQNTPKDDFNIDPGESFVIGNTVFTLHPTESQVATGPTAPGGPQPIEVTLNRVDLRRSSVLGDRAGTNRLEALAELQEFIRLGMDDEMLEDKVLDCLLKGIPDGDSVGIVMIPPDSTDAEPKVAVRRCRQRGLQMGDFRPSRKLVHRAVRQNLRGVCHVWNRESIDKMDVTSAPTMLPGTDWAIAAPLMESASFGWSLYVAGRLPRDLMNADHVAQDRELQEYQRFVDLIADLYGSTQKIRGLQQQLVEFKRFLPPRVLLAMDQQTIKEVLEPRATDVTVLFCDLRGSCRIAEAAKENLMRSWEQINEALTVMTDCIAGNDGVIGDLQGDAAMGFWGWPLADDNQIEYAVEAALAIRRRFLSFQERPSHLLYGFEVGIGLSHGLAVAGRLGTADQFKVDVFGPTVNLAARLEGMTKQFGTKILVDERIAEHLRAKDPRGTRARTRKMVKVRPVGMQDVVQVYEVLPPEAVAGPAYTERWRIQWEAMVDMFQKGEWENAKTILRISQATKEHKISAEFILKFMEENGGTPPDGWDKVLQMKSK